MIFTAAQLAGVWQGKIRRVLAVRDSCPVSVPAVRVPRREVIIRDLDGQRVGAELQVVEMVVTVVAMWPSEFVADLDLATARACGWKTTAELREDWRARHRHMDMACVLAFELGDWRDPVRMVSAGWPDYTADPGQAMRGEPEAVSRSDLERVSMLSGQAYAAGRLAHASTLATAPASARLRAVQRGSVVRPSPEPRG